MTVNTTLAGLSQSAAANGPDGASDPPSALDDAIRNALAFCALLRDGAHVYAASIAGTNTLTGTISTSPTAYVTGQAYRFIAANANTGAVTLNLNALGAKAITKNGSAALKAGDIQAGAMVSVVYDGTQFQLQNVAQTAALASPGSAQFSNGLIAKWGFATSSGTAAGNASQSFAAAFPNGMLVPLACVQSTGVASNLTVQVTASNSAVTLTTLSNGAITSGLGVYWVVLGY